MNNPDKSNVVVLADISRQNGSKSLGPVTESGKRMIRTNSLKHGLFSKALPQKDTLLTTRHEFDQLVAGLMEDYSPRTQTELMLVESLAVNYLRLRYIVDMWQAQIQAPDLELYKSKAFIHDIIPIEKATAYLAVINKAVESLEKSNHISLDENDRDVLIDIIHGQQDEYGDLKQCRDTLPPRQLQQLFHANDRRWGKKDRKDELRKMLTGDNPVQDTFEWMRWLKNMREKCYHNIEGMDHVARRSDMDKPGISEYLAVNGGPKIATLNRYEAHLRRCIERDIQMLLVFKRIMA